MHCMSPFDTVSLRIDDVEIELLVASCANCSHKSHVTHHKYAID